MILQYKRRREDSDWKNYSNKRGIHASLKNCDFRLLSQDGKDVIVDSCSYEKVLRKMRSIDFYKNRKGMRRLSFRFWGNEE